MKLVGLQNNLKNALHIVGHAVSKNINLPILNNILIRAESGNIKFISTNLEIGITHTLRGKIEEDGELSVDSKLISDYISLLPTEKVVLSTKDKNLIIECENFKTKIICEDTSDFPLIPVVEKKHQFSFDINIFKKALSQVVFAVSNSETRLELSGVLIVFDNKKITIVATDSYRLAEKVIDVETTETERQQVIIPAKTIQELIRILANTEQVDGKPEKINMYLAENQILFTFQSTELVSRVIEGQYPDYKQIIPVNIKTKAIISKKELIRSIKASSLFAKSGINDINLDFPKNKNKIIVSSVSNQTGESVVELDADVSGDDNGITINYRYLLDNLQIIESEKVSINIVNNNTPCVINPIDDKNYTYIIMPIKQ